jgi:hypothetical protein
MINQFPEVDNLRKYKIKQIPKDECCKSMKIWFKIKILYGDMVQILDLIIHIFGSCIILLIHKLNISKRNVKLWKSLPHDIHITVITTIVPEGQGQIHSRRVWFQSACYTSSKFNYIKRSQD